MPHQNHQAILLTGAPISSSLDWSTEVLQTALIPSFINDQAWPSTCKSTPKSVAPLWRSLPLHQSHLPTGLTQAGHPEWMEPCKSTRNEPFSFIEKEPFLPTSEGSWPGVESVATTQDQELAASQYYEHSFAVHEISSSLILPPASSTPPAASKDEESSFSSDHEARIAAHAHAVHARLVSGPLTDLKETPNASYLRSINPQTMTVNLVVGIISISPPRSIITRKNHKPIELVEMIVGDDTRAGFGISVWLPAQHTHDSRKTITRNVDLREQTLYLRPQDIVLAKNVALGSFRGTVRGQSLGGITTLELLYRNQVDRNDRSGVFKMHDLDETYLYDLGLRKLKRVRDWVVHFVGGKTKGDGATIRGVWSSLPSDTP